MVRKANVAAMWSFAENSHVSLLRPNDQNELPLLCIFRWSDSLCTFALHLQYDWVESSIARMLASPPRFINGFASPKMAAGNIELRILISRYYAVRKSASVEFASRIASVNASEFRSKRRAADAKLGLTPPA